MPRRLLLLGSAFVLLVADFSQADEKVLLAPNTRVGSVDRVSIEIEVGGKLITPRNAQDTKLADDVTQTIKSPMKLTGKLVYEQRLLAGTDTSPLRSARFYEQTDVSITTGTLRTKPKLADARRLIVSDHTKQGGRVWSPSGSLTSDEANLLTVVGNTLFCDQLLPVEAVAIGEKWEHSPGDMAALLGLDVVTACDAKSEITKVSKRYARVELIADVEGTMRGTASKMTLSAIYLVNTEQGRVRQFNLAVQENREVGYVTPGADIVAKLQITIDPQEEAQFLTDELVAKIVDEPAAELLMLTSQSRRQPLEVTHDRNWYVTADAAGVVTMRRIEDTNLVANCAMALKRGGAISKDDLAKLRGETRKALGQQFKQFTKETEFTTDQGYSGVAVVAIGNVQGIPVEWRNYVLANKQGQRVSFSFTMQESEREAFGDADVRLVDSLRIKPTEIAAVESRDKQ